MRDGSEKRKREQREREGECDRRHNVLRDAFGQSEHLSKQGSFNGRLTNGCGRERWRGRRDDGVALAHSRRHKRFQLHTSLSLPPHINMRSQAFSARSRFQLSFPKEMCIRVRLYVHVQMRCFGLSDISRRDGSGAVSITHQNSFFLMFHFQFF